MYKFIYDIKSVYSRHNISEKTPEPETPFELSLDTNIQTIQSRMNNTSDLTIHRLKLNGADAAVISIDNLINKDILAIAVIKPLFSYEFIGKMENSLEDIMYRILCVDDVTLIYSFEELYDYIMSGFAVIALENCSSMLAVGIQGYQSRSIAEPESDVIQRGSREGFVEPLRTNITLIRRRMKNPDLTFEIMKIGKMSATEVCICYLKNTASPAILDLLKKRLGSIDLNTVLAAGYLVPYLEENGRKSVFSTVGVTERPDTVVGKITEGRIAVIIDGVPSALIVPYLFAEYFQTLDDYSNKPYFAAFTRWLKYTAFFLSIMLPGLFTALGTFNPEMFPSLLLNKIAGSIGATPFSLMSETLLILIVYEVMRESGLRMPQPLGYAVSIVGGLVIGDTAVNAGLLGAPTLMVAAISAICSYIVPNLYAPAAVLRLLFTVTGGLAGIWGVSILFCVVFVDLCGKNSFGVPFTSPITPFGKGFFRDVILRAGWQTLSSEQTKVQYMPGANLVNNGDVK